MCCKKNNFYGRHFAVQEAMAWMALSGSQPFLREAAVSKHNAEVGPGPRALRPADLLLKAWQGGKEVAVDVTVKHPIQVDQAPYAGPKAEAYLKQIETRKETMYRVPCEKEGWLLTPAGFNIWGGVGPKAKDVLAKLMARGVAAVPTELQPLRRAELRQNLGVSLMRQVWKLLLVKNRVW